MEEDVLRTSNKKYTVNNEEKTVCVCVCLLKWLKKLKGSTEGPGQMDVVEEET